MFLFPNEILGWCSLAQCCSAYDFTVPAIQNNVCFHKTVIATENVEKNSIVSCPECTALNALQ